MPLYHSVKIGSLELAGNLFLAPVAGYSDRAFRSVCIECGANFTYTEMVSSEALVRESRKTEQLMLRAANESAYSVQIFGGDAHVMAAAAKIVIQKTNPQVIDINAGCPVQKIVKTGAGSALTREPQKLFKITQAVVNAASPIPVTVKIRSGWDFEHLTWKEAALAAYEAGAQAVTLHARTRSQGYEGKADWKILAQLVDLLQNKIPVFGSGDAFCAEDAKRMILETSCQAVMFARGAMGNPFIFEETKTLLTTGNNIKIEPKKRIEFGLKELELLCADKGELVACREMRKRFCAYSKGLSDAASLREKIVHANTIQDYKNLFNF